MARFVGLLQRCLDIAGVSLKLLQVVEKWRPPFWCHRNTPGKPISTVSAKAQDKALIIKRFHTDLKGVPHGLRHGFWMLRQDRVKTGICRRVVLSFKRFQRPRAAHLFWAVVDQDHLQHHKASEQEHSKDK